MVAPAAPSVVDANPSHMQRTVKLIAVLPPLLQRYVRPADESEGVVVHLSVERGQRLIDLSYTIAVSDSTLTASEHLLFWAISSTCDMRRTSVTEAIGCDSSKRQCLIDISSRRTTGRPVPRLILCRV